MFYKEKIEEKKGAKEGKEIILNQWLFIAIAYSAFLFPPSCIPTTKAHPLTYLFRVFIVVV
jgi:hypothetical protein